MKKIFIFNNMDCMIKVPNIPELSFCSSSHLNQRRSKPNQTHLVVLCFLSPPCVTGGVEADPDDREKCEVVRHGAAVFTNALPSNTKHSLLHVASRAADVFT